MSCLLLIHPHTDTPTHQHTNTPTHQHTNTPTHQHTESPTSTAGSSLSSLIAQREAAFDEKFDALFPIHPLLTADDEQPTEGPGKKATRAATQAAFSNLIGSMGYFHGSSLVGLPSGHRYRLPDGSVTTTGIQGVTVDKSVVVLPYWPAPLYTCTPSRSFFPRGFLWDEGFHQLLLQRWDAQLSRDAMAHWLDLLNSQGWIPREQILGAEAQARVPAEFIIQYPTHANPPSLFLPLLSMVRRLAKAEAEAEGAAGAEAAATRAWLERAWPRLEAWYMWFNHTQAGPVAGSYRWVRLGDWVGWRLGDYANP